MENYTSFLRVHAEGNQLEGNISANLGIYPHLNYVDISYNLSVNVLVGKITMELGDLTYLFGINLSHNQLSRMISLELGKLYNLESPDLSKNYLSGPIPQQLVYSSRISLLKL